MVPSHEDCSQLMVKHLMLENIRDHSVMVARIAEFLAEKLVKRGLDIPLDLTVSAALLHDIGKTPCLNNDGDHALLGRDICLRHGHHEIADIVAEHVVLKHPFPERPLSATEIVYYADKRVNHDKIVSIDQRLSYIIERYGLEDEYRCRAIRENFQHCRHIEKEIFSHFDFGPEDLPQKIHARNGTVHSFFKAVSF